MSNYHIITVVIEASFHRTCRANDAVGAAVSCYDLQT